MSASRVSRTEASQPSETSTAVSWERERFGVATKLSQTGVQNTRLRVRCLLRQQHNLLCFSTDLRKPSFSQKFTWSWNCTTISQQKVDLVIRFHLFSVPFPYKTALRYRESLEADMFEVVWLSGTLYVFCSVRWVHCCATRFWLVSIVCLLFLNSLWKTKQRTKITS